MSGIIKFPDFSLTLSVFRLSLTFPDSLKIPWLSLTVGTLVDTLIFLLIPLSHWNLGSLLLHENKHNGIETLTQCVEWSPLVVDYLLSVLWPKNSFLVIWPKTLQPFEITLKHCSEAVCTRPLHAAQPALASQPGTVNTPTSRQLRTLCC